MERDLEAFGLEVLGSITDYGAHLHVMESFLVSTAQELEKTSPGAAARILTGARQLRTKNDKLEAAINLHWDRLTVRISK